MAYMRRFMADAAHELRTPITILRTRAEVALQQPREAANYVDALRGVEAEARRLGTIVDSLLVLARADTGERQIDKERVFLDDRGAFVDLTTFHFMFVAEYRECEGPLVQSHPANPERIFHALAGTSDEPVERH